jgi:hypothetical protein
VGLRDKMRRLERAAEEETALVVCEECGEEFRVRQGVELELVAHSWTEGQKSRGEKVYREAVYQETPPDALAIANHRHGELAFINKRTGERLFASWGGHRDEA